MRKPLTNEQMFKRLFSEMSSIDIAIMRERLALVCDLTIESVNAGEFPENAIISPSFYKDWSERVIAIIGFEGSKQKPAVEKKMFQGAQLLLILF